jgi:hypothetical protein
MALFFGKFPEQAIYIFQQIMALRTSFSEIFTYFFTSAKIYLEHHVVRTFILTVVFSFHPFLEHLHNLHTANYTKLYRDMFYCSLHSVLPDHSI